MREGLRVSICTRACGFVVDLVVPVVGPKRRVRQPIERALAGERRAVRALRLEPVGPQRRHRLVAQPIVVVHVLVAQRDADDPLPDQGRQGVPHLVLPAAIAKARGDPLDQAERAIGVAQQQPAGIGGHGAAVERRRDRSPRSNLASD